MIRKQPISISMGQGLDQKSDPKQLPIGKLSGLQNTVFQKGGLLQKRNGYGSLPSLPDDDYTYLTTFNGNLTAIGTSLAALSPGANSWLTHGSIETVDIETLPLIRNSLNQSQCDSVLSANGLVCTAYTETGGASSPVYKYAIADSVTGQNVVAPTLLTATGSPRTFLLGNFFIIIYTNTTTLRYVAININSLVVNAPVTISSSYTSATTVNFDAFVVNESIYVAWNGSDGGGAIRMCFIQANLVQSITKVFAGRVATIMSVCADITGNAPIIYAVFYNSADSTGHALAVDQNLNTVRSPTSIITAETVLNITSSAQNQLCTFFYEIDNNYTYDATIPTNYTKKNTITQGGTVGTSIILIRSIGLASKSFILNGLIYFLGEYNSAYQPTYFLITSVGKVIAKLAYSNGGAVPVADAGYLPLGLPGFSISGDTVSIPYLVRDLIAATNKTQGAQNTGLPVYSQTGINLSAFTLTTEGLNTAEIGNNLNLSGGYVWAYDGYSLTEQNFHVWPDSLKVTTATGSGGVIADTYYYVALYEWSDNQGNVFRSAPSIPISITTTTATSTNTIKVPTLRLTSKTANPVKIVLYRWSVIQSTYYALLSPAVAPVLNSTTVDFVTIVDAAANSAIIGNPILYTTGGVVENIGPPAAAAMTLYKSRLFLVDAEDRNLLWFSKQVIEATPVEMSDLFTIYVAPTTSAAANTGPITALSALDDKLIIFKADAIYYITGTGPDNTGANNDFSDPIFITSTVGCANQASIVFMPQGLLFQSDKGIWLLGRDLSTQYIGAAVEDFNQYSVRSSVNVPATNQVRFTLSNGVTLMYDYYFSQWGTFVNVPAVSSCIYQGLHSYINSFGRAYQETPGAYLDGSSPVLIGFTTGWINPAGLQGYIRSYFFYILGQYLTPHKLQLNIAYDYSSSPSQSTIISPSNYSPAYGGDSPYGAGDPYGGPGDLEQWRVFLTRQRCLAFQIQLNEIYDPSFGVPAGAGLTISGLNLIVGLKSGFNTIGSAHSIGGGG